MSAFVCENPECRKLVRYAQDRFEERVEYRQMGTGQHYRHIKVRNLCRRCVNAIVAENRKQPPTTASLL